MANLGRREWANEARSMAGGIEGGGTGGEVRLHYKTLLITREEATTRRGGRDQSHSVSLVSVGVFIIIHPFIHFLSFPSA